ncbi:MAG: sodium:proton antiporter [Blautia sp.]|nr:sodium:proton antiporter [Blautia sp.]
MEIMRTQPWIFHCALIFLAILLLFCLFRAIVGPTIADRVVAVNMMGTMVMVIISILALQMNEGYLVDICLIYAMISFLAVVVLTKIYMGVYLQRKDKGRKLKELEKEEDAIKQEGAR